MCRQRTLENMTTFSYTLVFDDSESIVLEAALKMMIKQCEAELAADPEARCWASHRSAKELLSRLSENAEITSYSTFPRDPAK